MVPGPAPAGGDNHKKMEELPEAGSLGRRGASRGIIRPSNHTDRIDAIFGALGGGDMTQEGEVFGTL